MASWVVVDADGGPNWSELSTSSGASQLQPSNLPYLTLIILSTRRLCIYSLSAEQIPDLLFSMPYLQELVDVMWTKKVIPRGKAYNVDVHKTLAESDISSSRWFTLASAWQAAAVQLRDWLASRGQRRQLYTKLLACSVISSTSTTGFESCHILRTTWTTHTTSMTPRRRRTRTSSTHWSLWRLLRPFRLWSPEYHQGHREV